MGRRRKPPATERPPSDAEVSHAAVEANKAVAVKAREDFHVLIEHVLRDDHGQPIDLQECQVEGLLFIRWAQEQGLFPIIMAPMGSGKTTAYVIPLILRAIGQDNNVRVGVFSNEEGLASDRVGTVKDYIETSEEYNAVYPGLKSSPDVWGAHEFKLKRTSKDPTPTCAAKGILGSKVGRRYDLIILDDITDFENSLFSMAKRKAVDDRLHGVVMNRLSKNGNLFGTGTAWHTEDALIKLQKDDRFAVLIQAVSDDCTRIIQTNLVTGETKEMPLPKTLDTKALLKEKSNRPREFQRGRQNIAISEAERTFKDADVLAAIEVGGPPLEGMPIGIGVDVSSDKRPGNAIVEGAYEDSTMILHVDEMELMQDTSPNVFSYIAERVRQRAAEWAVVENNAYQQSAIEWAQATGDEAVPWEAFTTGRNKADLDSGIPGLGAAFKSGGVRLHFKERPEHCAKGLCECETGMCKLVKDLRAHPFGPTDSIMGLWFLWRKFRVDGSAVGDFGDATPLKASSRIGYSSRENLQRLRGNRRGRRSLL